LFIEDCFVLRANGNAAVRACEYPSYLSKHIDDVLADSAVYRNRPLAPEGLKGLYVGRPEISILIVVIPVLTISKS
jgi:hypothetical protein